MANSERYMGKTRLEWEEEWDRLDDTAGEPHKDFSKMEISEILGVMNSLDRLRRSPHIQLRLISDLLLKDATRRNNRIRQKLFGRNNFDKLG